jgi:hypothetical protein
MKDLLAKCRNRLKQYSKLATFIGIKTLVNDLVVFYCRISEEFAIKEKLLVKAQYDQDCYIASQVLPNFKD